MKTVIVTSRNPVKIDAVRTGFQALFPDQEFVFEGKAVASGVSDQPMSDGETLSGARNRVMHGKKAFPKADYWVGIEGGIEIKGAHMMAFAWIVIRSWDTVGTARTGSFELPPKVAELVATGMELGAADDVVFGTDNSKQKSGAVGLLTDDVIDRSALYAHAVILALIPFKSHRLYP